MKNVWYRGTQLIPKVWVVFGDFRSTIVHNTQKLYRSNILILVIQLKLQE